MMNRTPFPASCILVLPLALSLLLCACSAPKKPLIPPEQREFDQVLQYSEPVEFSPPYSRSASLSYKREYVGRELTGCLGGACFPRLNAAVFSKKLDRPAQGGKPLDFAAREKIILDHYKAQCTEGASLERLPHAPPASGHGGSAFVLGCAGTGLQTFYVLIEGTKAMYMLVWLDLVQDEARKGKIDRELWLGRLEQLQPITLRPMQADDILPLARNSGHIKSREQK